MERAFCVGMENELFCGEQQSVLEWRKGKYTPGSKMSRNPCKTGELSLHGPDFDQSTNSSCHGTGISCGSDPKNRMDFTVERNFDLGWIRNTTSGRTEYCSGTKIGKQCRTEGEPSFGRKETGVK
ncbi:MAG: hypothetical protein II983_04005 [Firmicutes bacterium]|nr:hypothetical protein [Bacillota bacterium]